MTTLALSKRGNTQGATHPSEDLRKQAGITNGCQSNASVRDESIYQPVHVAPIQLFRRKRGLCERAMPWLVSYA